MSPGNSGWGEAYIGVKRELGIRDIEVEMSGVVRLCGIAFLPSFIPLLIL